MSRHSQRTRARATRSPRYSSAGSSSSKRHLRESLLVTETELARVVRRVARDALVTGRLVETDGLLLAVACLEHDARIAQPSGLPFELFEQAAAEPAPAGLRDHVHALHLAARVVEARDPAASDRPVAAVAHNEEDTVRLDEHRRLARRPDVGLALVELEHLRLLRGAERNRIRRV